MSVAETTPRQRVMSGMRPTGALHLGHYVGVLSNWVTLQSQYDCFFMIADWHALTTKYASPGQIQQHIVDVALDWLASGLDPQQCTIYVQSRVPQIAELHLLLSMLTPNKWVETDPTLKDMVAMLSEDLTYGLLGYPVLQAADILSVRGDFVPVGKDQLAHLEIVRDIVTRFNHLYQTDLLPSPKPLLTQTPLLPGMNNQKMGKSAGNAIYLSDSEDETWAKLKKGITDEQRIKRDDPGNPARCQVIYPYYQVFAAADAQALAKAECEAGARGCMDCKKILNEALMETLRPLRARRAELAQNVDAVHAILDVGNQRAADVCTETLGVVKGLMGLLPL